MCVNVCVCVLLSLRVCCVLCVYIVVMCCVCLYVSLCLWCGVFVCLFVCVCGVCVCVCVYSGSHSSRNLALVFAPNLLKKEGASPFDTSCVVRVAVHPPPSRSPSLSPIHSHTQPLRQFNYICLPPSPASLSHSHSYPAISTLCTPLLRRV